jgi:hypothetical protein
MSGTQKREIKILVKNDGDKKHRSEKEKNERKDMVAIRTWSWHSVNAIVGRRSPYEAGVSADIACAAPAPRTM